jgi:hypothetical protein
MVMSVEWSDLAKTQLKNIYDYYAITVNRRLAKKIITKLYTEQMFLPFIPIPEQKNLYWPNIPKNIVILL